MGEIDWTQSAHYNSIAWVIDFRPTPFRSQRKKLKWKKKFICKRIHVIINESGENAQKCRIAVEFATYFSRFCFCWTPNSKIYLTLAQRTLQLWNWAESFACNSKCSLNNRIHEKKIWNEKSKSVDVMSWFWCISQTERRSQWFVLYKLRVSRCAASFVSFFARAASAISLSGLSLFCSFSLICAVFAANARMST